jgi:folate-binding protein YgfZ
MIDIETQYKAVREGIGLIDRSDVGKIAIYGEDRFTWLQGMVSNDVKYLSMKGLYSSFSACVLDATGHVLTDLSLVRVNHNKGQHLAEFLNLPVSEFILAALPRENVNKIMSLWERFIIMEDVELKDVSEVVGCVSLQGKNAYNLWDMASPLAEEPVYQFWKRVYTMPADHVGTLMGFDAYFPIQEKQQIQSILNGEGYPTIGAEAQEILRVEAGIPKYGVDMDETTLAPEAGLMQTHISLTKGCYVGQEIVARIDSRGHTNRALTGLVFETGDVPASGDRIIAREESGGTRETGRVTSVIAASPAMNGRPIALGYVRHEHRAPGSRLQVQGANVTHATQVVELPFYRRPESGPPPTKGAEI